MIHFDFKTGPKIYVRIPSYEEAEHLRLWLLDNTDVTWASGTSLSNKVFHAGRNQIVSFRTHHTGVQMWDVPDVVDPNTIVYSVDEFILMQTEEDIDEDESIDLSDLL